MSKPKVQPPTVTVFSSPKERYNASVTRITEHQNMVDSRAFELGADAAMLQLVEELADKVTDQLSACAAGYQLRGAVRYQRQLKQFAEPAKPLPIQEDLGALVPPEHQPKRRD
jgi:hypothetical protein